MFKVFVDKPAILAAMAELLEPAADGNIYIGEGPRVEEFEHNLRANIGAGLTPLPLAVNSGTSALWLALDLAGVGPGDVVVSTPITCAATNIVIRQRGATIAWADVDPASGNIDPASVQRLLYSLKCKAVMCVDYGGVPCLLDELKSLCEAHGVKLIEDAAHSLGATYQGRPIGQWADFTCFSFQAIKALTTSDGGALLCLDPKKREEGRLKRWFGLDRSKGGFRCGQEIELLGYKMHMTDVAAAIGLANLPHLAGNLFRARGNARYYLELLAGEVRLPSFLKESEPTWWLFTLRVPDRTGFIAKMAERGVQCAQTHARNDRHPIFRDSYFDGERLAGVEEFDREQVQIPVGWWVNESMREQIVQAVRESL